MAGSPGWPRKLSIFLPPIAVILLVAGEGTQRFSIENSSGLLSDFWFRHFASLPYQRFWEFVETMRKLGHVVGYGVACLAFFFTTHWWLSRRSSTGGWGMKNRAAGWALILTMLLGSADELHQRFVPQRTSTVTDVGFDVCGGFFALMFFFAASRLKDRISSPSPDKVLEHAAG